MTARADPVTLFFPSGAGVASRPLLRHLRKVLPEGSRLVTCDLDESGLAAGLVDGFKKAPPRDSPEYGGFLVGLCAEERVDVALPATSIDVLALATHKEALASAGTVVLTSSLETCQAVTDKTLSMARACAAGVAVPSFVEATDLASFESGLEELGYPDNPICVKPAHSVSGSGRGFRVLDANAFRTTRLVTALTSELYTIEADAYRMALEHTKFPFPILMMEYLSGPEYSVYGLCENGEPAYLVPHLREKLFETNSLQCVVDMREEIVDSARRLCAEFGLDHLVNVQLRYSEHGVPKLVEINPRVGGSVMLSVAAGIDLPLWAILRGLGRPFPIGVKPRNGMRMTRYFNEEFTSPGGDR